MSENKEVGIQAVGLPVTDDNPVTTTILPSEGLAMFEITGIDPDMRYISVTSDVELSIRLLPKDNFWVPVIKFDSLDPRVSVMMAWHFLPGVQYELFVFPKTTPASVIVSMSKNGSGYNVVYNKNGQPFEEKNSLSGGNGEVYGFAFQTRGRYRFTVDTSISKLFTTFGDSRNTSQSETQPSDGRSFRSQYVFEKTIEVTGNAQNYYMLNLISQDTPGSGAPYKVSVQRIG